MGRVKKGSALLNVLMIAMILTMTAGVITTAVVQTTKGNVYKKETDDLTYAAESGIQQAISNVDNLIYQTTPLPHNFNINAKFSGQGIQVNVEVKKHPINNWAYQVTSVATKTVDGTTRKRTVKATIKKVPSGNYGTNNLFKYSLCGDESYVYYIGAANPSTVKINGMNGIYSANNLGASNVELPQADEKFEIPKFENIPYNNGTIVLENLTQLHGKSGTVEQVKNGIKEYVYESFTPTSSTHASPLNIYIVNAKQLLIKTDGGGGMLNQAIIVCSGNVTLINSSDLSKVESNGLPRILGVNSNGTKRYEVPNITSPQPFQLEKSTIIAEKIGLYTANTQLGSPVYSDRLGDNPAINHIDDLIRLNDIIRKYDPDWSSNNSLDGPPTWGDTDVSYE